MPAATFIVFAPPDWHSPTIYLRVSGQDAVLDKESNTHKIVDSQAGVQKSHDCTLVQVCSPLWCQSSSCAHRRFLQMTMLEPLIKTNSRSQTKRNDIQVLRFVAIAAVLGFHLRPKAVPQGYLGVDIFFVISGYLMTLITASSNGVISLGILRRFYERRLKRLCPTYIITLLTTIAVGNFILIATEFELFRSDSFWALVFGTNIQSMFAQEDYFQLVSEYKFLLHTWSLSVEVQFYLAAPFILALIAKSGCPLITCGIISGLSMAFQAFVPSPTWAFGCVLSRIWQFLIGTAVFYLEKRRQQTNSHTSSNINVICGSILLVTLLLIPELSVNSVYKFAIRVLATSLTGILMYYAPTVDEKQALKPTIRVIAIFGDASYSIYLVHWPMIVFAQYLDIFDYMNIYTQLAYILLVAFVQYSLFEKRITSYETKTIFTICGVLYFLAVIILFSSYNTEMPMSANVDVRKLNPILGNQLIIKNCNCKNRECPHAPDLDAIVPNTTYAESYFCEFKGHGKRTVFVAGNSYALFQVEAVKKALKGQYKTIYLSARPGCIAFDAINRRPAINVAHKCDELVGLTEKILKTVKPDVMMIIQRIDNQENFVSGKALNTTIVKYLESELAKYSKHTKKILIVEPTKVFKYYVPQKIAKTLKNGESIDKVSIPKDEHHRIHKTWQTMLTAMKSCPKCEPLWIREHLCHTEICPLYDEKTKLALYCDSNHLSPLGIDKIVPAFQSALKRSFQEISSA